MTKQAKTTDKYPLEGYDNYFINPDERAVFKKDAKGLYKRLKPLKVGGNDVYRLTKNGNRRSFQYEAVLRLAVIQEVKTVKAKVEKKAAKKETKKEAREAVGKQLRETPVQESLPTPEKEMEIKRTPSGNRTASEQRAYNAAKAQKLIEEKPELHEKQMDKSKMKSLGFALEKFTGKLTLKEIFKIKDLLDTTDMKQKEIAEQFGVHPSTISEINTGVMFGTYTIVKSVNDSK